MLYLNLNVISLQVIANIPHPPIFTIRQVIIIHHTGNLHLPNGYFSLIGQKTTYLIH